MGLIKPEKAITIYNAISPTLTTALQEIAQNRKTGKGNYYWFYFTVLSSKKCNQFTTASVMPVYRSKKLKFIYLGEGEYYELCKAIHSYGLEERILLPGWDKNVLPWLKVFNVFVLFSRWEAMLFSIIEAMHSGLPIIVSTRSLFLELVDSQTGYIVPLDNNAELTKTFIEIAQDFDTAYRKYKQLSAKKIALQFVLMRKMVNAYRELYLSAN